MIAAATEFQPGSAAELLALCAGEWMCLRSKYMPAGGDEDWQQSERADLQWSWLASTEPDQLGTLQFQAKGKLRKNCNFLVMASCKLQQVIKLPGSCALANWN